MLVGPAIIALASCRGVIGIEDLDVVKDGGSTKTDAGGGTDAIADTNSADSPMPGTDGGKCSGLTGMACGMCCHDDSVLKTQFPLLQNIAVDSGCACGG